VGIIVVYRSFSAENENTYHRASGPLYRHICRGCLRILPEKDLKRGVQRALTGFAAGVMVALDVALG